MGVDKSMERLYGAVGIIRGAGDPSCGKLSLLSFVAYLAGEKHSNNPDSASLLIREFLLAINDRIPSEFRDRLKPFVPRIIGTNDGWDIARAALLSDIVTREIVPRVEELFTRPNGIWRMWRRKPLRKLRSQLLEISCNWSSHSDPMKRKKLAETVAALLCYCAAHEQTRELRSWYWYEAINIVDRLCDIRGARSLVQLDEAQIQQLTGILSQLGCTRWPKGTFGHS